MTPFLRVVVCGSFLPAVLWAQAPPADCQGGESFQFEIQASLDGGASWSSNDVTLYLLPGETVNIAVRTLMSVTAGETQGWSFSLKQNAVWSQYYGGGINVTGVTIDGTDTVTVQNGGLPDLNCFHLWPDGYTHGVLIDVDTGITLPPVRNFVTSRACYQVTAPSYYGSYLTPLQFTHDLGNPHIRSVVTQKGRSNIPCTASLNLYLNVNGLYSEIYPGCALSGSSSSNPTAMGSDARFDGRPEPAGSAALLEELRPGGGMDAQAPRRRTRFFTRTSGISGIDRRSQCSSTAFRTIEWSWSQVSSGLPIRYEPDRIVLPSST